MIGAPGTSDAARTSTDNSVSTQQSAIVTAAAGVGCHWAAGAEQSTDSSLPKVDGVNALVTARRAKPPVSSRRTKRLADGASQLVGRALLAPDISEEAVSSFTLVDEVSARVGFWPNRSQKRWPRAANVMSFASLAHVVIVGSRCSHA
jgi:hypothetical protein